MTSAQTSGHHHSTCATDRKETPMNATTLPSLSSRDRSVLRAVAAGRCGHPGPGHLTVDGVALADQFAGLRLIDAGLITSAPGAVALTVSGAALLAAA
jgi:hypothetical protein